MDRQRVRKLALWISALLFPVTIYYLSPVLIIGGAAQGVVGGSLIAFTMMFFFSLFLGRGFCGWVCPAGGIQEACFKVKDRRLRGGRGDLAKYFIWAPWLGIIAVGFIYAGGVHSIDPFYMTRYGISVTDISGVIALAIFTVLIVALALAGGRRAMCHYGCWMAPFMIIGAKVRNKGGWSSLHLDSDKSKCIDCKTCTKNCPMSLDVNGMVQKGSMINNECILCGSCVDSCKKSAITYSFDSGRKG